LVSGQAGKSILSKPTEAAFGTTRLGVGIDFASTEASRVQLMKSWVVRYVVAALSALLLALPASANEAANGKVRVVVFLDSSKSSQHLRPNMKGFIEDLIRKAEEPEKFSLVLYRLGSTVEQIYSGPFDRTPELKANLAKYTGVRAEAGTPLGPVFDQAAVEARQARAAGESLAVIVLSDCQDEPGTKGRAFSLNPAKLPNQVKALGSGYTLAFCFVDPSLAFTQKYNAIASAVSQSHGSRILVKYGSADGYKPALKDVAKVLFE
jgi:hypothetical protein